jgi:hypothetical protein
VALFITNSKHTHISHDSELKEVKINIRTDFVVCLNTVPRRCIEDMEVQHHTPSSFIQDVADCSVSCYGTSL